MNENNSPSDDANLEQNNSSELLDEAMREKDTLLSPPPDHGWLEQFQAFGHAAFAELEAVAGDGLTEVETELLCALAVKLIRLAKAHDSKALDKVVAAV